jgi:hypothetical protein
MVPARIILADKAFVRESMKAIFSTSGLASLILCCVALSCAAADVILDSAPGKKFVGDQLRAFSVEPDGAICSVRDAQINLYYTEGAPFRLSGKVWLAGPSKTLDHPGDLPDGLALFLREWDSLHRYSLTSRSLTVKRRLLEGVRERKITEVAAFEAPANGQWISFTVEATPEQITYRFGQFSAVIKGPLDMDGANKIVLAPGAKIKDVQLEILESSTTKASPAAAANISPASIQQSISPALGAKLEAGGKLALSFRTVPGQTYRLQFKNDLTDLTWMPLGGPITANDSNTVVHDDLTQPRRFYSVVAQQP